jgi:hypothetical protein
MPIAGPGGRSWRSSPRARPALRELERQYARSGSGTRPGPQPLARGPALRPLGGVGRGWRRAPSPSAPSSWSHSCSPARIRRRSRPTPSQRSIPPTIRWVKSIPARSHPRSAGGRHRGLWVLSRGSWTMARIDPRTRRLVRSFGPRRDPGQRRADGEVWVSDGCSIGGKPWTGGYHPVQRSAADGRHRAWYEEIRSPARSPDAAPHHRKPNRGNRCLSVWAQRRRAHPRGWPPNVPQGHGLQVGTTT